MKNSKLDWKGVGQFMAVLVKVWTIIRQVVVREKVGLEILDWMVGDGEQDVRNLMYGLSDKYKEYLSLQRQLAESVIDFDLAPFCPLGLTVAPDSDQISSRVRGKKKFNEIRIRLYADSSQSQRDETSGKDLKAKLEGQEVFGAQLLRFYLENPDFIPEDWKNKGLIFFWGTIYHNILGNTCVLYLCWTETRWSLGCRDLSGDWPEDLLAAASEKPSESQT